MGKKLNLAIVQENSGFIEAMMFGVLKWPIKRNHRIFVVVNSKILCSMSLAEGHSIEIIVYDPSKPDPFEIQLIDPLPETVEELRKYAKTLKITEAKALSLVDYNMKTNKINSFVDFFHSYYSYMFRHHIQKLIKGEANGEASKG